MFSKYRITSVLLSVLFLFNCGARKGNVQDRSDIDKTVQKAKEIAQLSGFQWDMASGSQIKVLLNQHPYAEAIVKKIPEFEKITGIKVEYAITPEENYFDKVTTSLNSRTGDPDVFMTGAYQIWEYTGANFIQSLDPFIQDSNLMNPGYDIDDIYPGVLSTLRWDLVPGHMTGSGSQWALPLGFELYTLAYNKKVFKKYNLTPPKTIEGLISLCEKLQEFDGKGTYPIALRGSRNWGTIHPGFMSTFANYGARDFVVENGKLVSKVNSPESVKMTEDWVRLIKTGGAPAWSSYTWYQAGADLGAGKAAILFDADINGYFQTGKGASKEAKNIAWAVMPLPEGQKEINSNLWTWAIAMNKASCNKLAAWLFLQYFTSAEYSLWSALEMNAVDPARKSVWNNPDFQAKMVDREGYYESFKVTIDGTRILFTPQPHFFETTTEWAATLQNIVAGKYASVQEGLDALKKRMDKTVEDIVIE